MASPRDEEEATDPVLAEIRAKIASRTRDVEELRELEREQLGSAAKSLWLDFSDLFDAALTLGEQHQTGFPTIDAGTDGGLARATVCTIQGKPGIGKAQPLDAKILTPSGFVRMGNLRVGDFVIGSSGDPVKVLAVFDRGPLPVFRVLTNDGRATECCAEHLWFTRTRQDRLMGRRGSVRALSEIAETMHRRCHDGGLNHSLPSSPVVQFAKPAILPIHPYLLGAYLGDGSTRERGCVSIWNEEDDVRRRLVALSNPLDAVTLSGRLKMRFIRRKKNNRHSEIAQALVALGLSEKFSHEKYVPIAYLLASVDDRRELLRGLLDTDGHVGCSIDFITTSQQLGRDLTFLVRSLGGRCTTSEKVTSYAYRGEKKHGRKAYRLIISFSDSLPAPVASEKNLKKYTGTTRPLFPMIASVVPIGVKDCRCILVDSLDHLYLTDDFIPTHNTLVATQIARHLGRNCAVACLFADEGLTGARIRLGQQLGLERQRMRRPDEVAKAAACKALKETAVFWRFLQPRSRTSTVEFMAQDFERIAPKELPRVWLIDSAQVVKSERTGQKDRRLVVSDLVWRVRELADEYKAVALLVSQVNRGSYSAKDKEKRVDDLAAGSESSAIEYSSELILHVDGNPKETVEIRAAKNRYTGELFSAHCSVDFPSATFREIDGPQAEAERQTADDVKRLQVVGKARDAVLKELRKAPEGMSGRALREVVSGRPVTIAAAIQELYSLKLIYHEPSGKRGGGEVWKAVPG